MQIEGETVADPKDPAQLFAEAAPMLSHHIQIVVSAGVTSSGVQIGDLDSITVLSGGVASATTVTAGGDEIISSGGSSFNDVISGGFVSISAGGVANNLLLSSGEVDGPGELLNATIGGGTVSGAFLSGFTQVFGGAIDGSTVGAGSELLFFAGSGSGLFVSGSGAGIGLNPTVSLSGVTLESGGSAVLVANSAIDGVTVFNGGFLDDQFGTVSDVTVSSGGVEGVDLGGSLDLGTTVSRGGLEFVENGGVASNTVLSSGGAETVSTLGAVHHAVVLSGGVLTVSSGTNFSASVESGGLEVVESGGADGGSTVFAGGLLKLTAGATIAADTVASGGTLDLVSMSVAGGTTFILPTTVALTTVISNVTIEAGGLLALEAPVVDAGGLLSLTAGTETSGAIVSSGGVLDGPGELRGDAPNFDYGLISGVSLGDAAGGHGELNIGSGGVARQVQEVGAADYLVVDARGVAVGTRVTGAGALFVVDSGARANGTFLAGADAVNFGLADEAQVVSGGVEYDYGRALGTSLRAGGEEIVEAHGTATGTTIGFGGKAIVSSGGVAVATRIAPGGTLTVSSGGALTHGLTLSGGSAIISGMMAAGQTVSFAGTTGEIQLDNLAGFRAKISGLGGAGDKVDLGGFAFSSTGETVSWIQTGTSGTLTVRDGTKIARLSLIGTYAKRAFALAGDGHGGTVISDPTGAPAAAAANFVQNAAGLHDGRDAGLGVASCAAPFSGAATVIAHATSG